MMEFLKNERAYKRWIKNKYGVESTPPVSYPVWVYLIVVSFGMEEERPEYLYETDLRKMLDKIESLRYQ